MAKGKNAAALFEVIHADKRFGKKQTAARALSTPKWWFKGKDRASAAGLAAPVAHDSNDPTQSAPRFEPTLHVAAPDPTAMASQARPPVNVAVNPDRQEIAFKLTYTSAILSLFALIVVLALVYIVGRRMSNGPTPVMANTADILKGEANPRVLEVGAADRPTPSGRSPAAPTAKTSPPLPPIETAPAAPTQHTFAEDGPRILGLNYLVIQSYPLTEMALAEDAVKVLKENGVNCTIERGVSGWSSNWYNVVGTRGFDRIRNNPEYDAYKAKIIQISKDQTDSRKGDGKAKFKEFAPLPTKWSDRR
jgi:hypothetical protein